MGSFRASERLLVCLVMRRLAGYTLGRAFGVGAIDWSIEICLSRVDAPPVAGLVSSFLKVCIWKKITQSTVLKLPSGCRLWSIRLVVLIYTILLLILPFICWLRVLTIEISTYWLRVHKIEMFRFAQKRAATFELVLKRVSNSWYYAQPVRMTDLMV